MNLLPPDLRLRLETIFSQGEMAEIDHTFAQTHRAVSFRVNTLISNPAEVESELLSQDIAFTKIDFLENAYILDAKHQKSDLWKTDSYKNGYIYIQGISSQIPVGFFSHTQQILSPKSPLNSLISAQDTSLNSLLPEEMNTQLRILDACAAPGGKTSQLAARFPDAEIWAFEPQKIRLEKMKYNLGKLGITLYNPHLNSLKSTQDTNSHLSLKGGPKGRNPISSFQEKGATVICVNDSIENIEKYLLPSSPGGEEIQKGGFEYFDMILVDAPCSGEGSISYHDTNFLTNWSFSHIKKNYARQKVICDAVLPYLKTGGEMIYSTCTIAPEENEAVIHYLLCKYSELFLENIDFRENKYIKYKNALKSFGKNIFRKEISEQTVRVIPSEFSEGFYIAKLRKGDYQHTNDLK